MNPELLRNLWLEAQPLRLALIAGLLLLVFAATSAANGLVPSGGVALALYWFFAVLWGTRSAALAVVGEIRERTWDGQKLSAIGPWQMMWGKLLGATSANWFGAVLCLVVIVASAWRESGPANALSFGAVLAAQGLFAQAVALLSSLMLIRRQSGNWRLDTFLCQVAGVGAAFAYYSLWSSVDAFLRSGAETVNWWGHDFNLSAFHFVSLLLFLGWALVGCYRAMRAELRFANGPWVWLAWLLYLCVYDAGFAPEIEGRLAVLSAMPPASVKLALAGLALLGSAYGMAFLEPKDPVRLRWLAEQAQAGNLFTAFLALDAWMLSYGATFVVGLLLAAMWVAGNPALALAVLAMLGFLTRDIAIFVLMRGLAGARGDFGALAVLGALYLLAPVILSGLGFRALDFLFLPTPQAADLALLAGWVQGIGAAIWAVRSIRRAFTGR
jgi:hypothetical protein